MITGVSGQDGTYLAEKLLADGYVVFGLVKDQSRTRLERLEQLGVLNNRNLNIVSWDLSDFGSTASNLDKISPDEIYNLASHSFVADSIGDSAGTTAIGALAVANLLSAVSESRSEVRFFQAGSSEMFGEALTSPQNEYTPFYPRNLYGSAKVFAHLALGNFRKSGGVFASTAILYNHESPLRGKEFVSRKITSSVVRIKSGKQELLSIGNLSALRDWGFAPEYVDAMRAIVAHDEPSEFVISTGNLTSVRDFVTMAFACVDVKVEFHAAGLEEKGYDSATGKLLVSVDPTHYRESERVPLVGDPSKAREVLGWEAKTEVPQIVELMMSAELEALSLGQINL